MKRPEPNTSKNIVRALHGTSSRERLLHRLHSVVFALSSSAVQAAKTYGDSPRAVAYWVERFREDGIEGLKEEARSGRPATLNRHELRVVQVFVQRSKAKSKPVNSKVLAQYIRKRLKLRLSQHLCWRILSRLKT